MDWIFIKIKELISRIFFGLLTKQANRFPSKPFVFKNTAPKAVKPAGAESGFLLSELLFKTVNAGVMCLLLTAAVNAVSESFLFFGDESGAASKELILLFAVFIVFFVFFFNARILRANGIEKNYKPLMFALFAFIVAVQIVMLCSFDAEQITDAYMINDQALSIVVNGQTQVDPGNLYFQVYANNNLMLVLTVWFYKALRLFGADLQSNLPFALLNTALIDASVAISTLAVKRMLGKKYAAGFLLLNALNPLTYLFLFWSYTLVYSMPVAAAEVYLLSLLAVLPKSEIRKRFVLFAVLGAVCVFGYFIRPTTLIPVIAAALISFFRWKPEKKELVTTAATLCGAAAVCVLVFIGAKTVTGRYVTDSGRHFPVTHWIMMGLTEDGRIDAADFAYTYQFDTAEEMKAGTAEEIKNRISSYSAPSFIDHLVKNLNTTWSDGRNGYTVWLSADAKQSVLNPFIFGDRAGTLHAYCFAFRIFTLFSAAGCLFLTLRKKNKQNLSVCFASVTIGGAILFYLIWEAKNVYSTPFIPFLLLLSQDFITGAEERAGTHIKNKLATAGTLTLVFTLVLGVSLYAPLTRAGDVRRYALKCECNNWWFYTDYIGTLSENGDTLSQSFVTQKAFDEIRLSCSTLDADAAYRIDVADANGVPLTQTTVRKEEVTDQFLSLRFDLQTPEAPAAYTITITPADPGEKDSICWHSKKTLATDQYEGQAYLNGIETADINICVLQTTQSSYLPPRLFFAMFGVMIAAELAALYVMKKRLKDPTQAAAAAPCANEEVSGCKETTAAAPIQADN